MPDYKEINATARKWQRCRSISIDNPYMRQPSVTFQEEEMAELDGYPVSRPIPGIVFPFDPTKIVPIRDPSTGLLTGNTISMGEVYEILWSTYIGKAFERDAKLVLDAAYAAHASNTNKVNELVSLNIPNTETLLANCINNLVTVEEDILIKQTALSEAVTQEEIDLANNELSLSIANKESLLADKLIYETNLTNYNQLLVTYEADSAITLAAKLDAEQELESLTI